MRGFFSKEDVQVERNCQACGLFKTCRSPRMNYTGQGGMRALIIGEAPGETEDAVNAQFEGKAGGLFRKHLSALGYNLDLDFWKINACNCRPPDNRKPTRTELKCCWPRVERVVRELQPRFIFLMGGSAVESFYMENFSDVSITRWRHHCIPDPDYNAWILPLYHPSFVLRSRDKKLEMIFANDLKWALSCMHSRDLPIFPQFDVHILWKVKEVQSLLRDILKKRAGTIVFDYETNGLNPFKISDPGIYSLAIANDDGVFSFPYDPAWVGLWQEILMEGRIRKVAHNIKFEDKWSWACFKVHIQGWIWDTMVSQHVLDNRKKITGLKFQAYVRYGAKNYDKEIRIYITNWTKAPPEKVLRYGGMDAQYTKYLYADQQKEFSRRKHLQAGNNLFFNGLLALAKMEQTGVPVDIDYFKKQDHRLEGRIHRLEKMLYQSEEAQQFELIKKRPINFGSPADMRFLLYDILKLPVVKKTNKDQEGSTDQEVIGDLQTPFSQNLIRYRKLEKTKGTYLAQFIREYCIDGKIHTNLDLHLVTSYRGSSSDPNLQNIPVRDEVSKKIVRSGVMPSPGNKVLEADYGSMEVRIMACYTGDEVLIDYLISGGDMHRDEAQHTFLITNEEWSRLDPQVAKDARFFTKNQKVFPYFYGSWYEPCGQALWITAQELGIDQHLQKKGIYNEEDFLTHMRADEDRFWRKFNGVRTWQGNVEDEYLNRGKISYFTGFEVGGYLRKNQLLNMRIQGTAFHCLLWVIIELFKEFRRRHYKSKIMMQIHDSLVIDLVPAEEAEILELITEVMTVRLRKEWKWIIVPLVAEFEMTKVDEAWYYKEKI